MNKKEFLDRLKNGISSLPYNEVEERVNFYSEMIDDLNEEGLSEEEAVSKIGNVDEIISQILSDTPTEKAEKQKKFSPEPWQIVLIILGAPLWLSLLIALASVVLSVYVSIFAAFAAIVGSAIGLFASGILFIFTKNALSGLALVGTSLVLGGLSIGLFFLCKLSVKVLLWIFGKRSFITKKRSLVPWIIAAILLVAGTLIFVSALGITGWSFASFDTSEYIENTYVIDDNFDNVLLKTNVAKTTFVKSADEKCRVICYEDTLEPHSVSVKNGTLEIASKNNKKWYDYIGINISSPKVTVYLPEKVYSSVSIDESTGDIFIKDISTDVIDIELTTGDVYIIGTSCISLTVDGTTCDTVLTDVIASDKMSITQTTGDIEFTRCDAGEIFMKTTTGDIEGSFLSEKLFLAKSTTGDVELPRTTSGGKCELTTTTGDIEIELEW